MSSSLSYSPTQIEFMCSGGVWSLFCFLLFFLCYEQYSASRYPQNVITFLLSLGFVLRCIWFFAQGEDIAEASPTNSAQRITAFAMINRLAFLLIFSALSMLIVMWTRIGVQRETSFRETRRDDDSKIMAALYDATSVKCTYYFLLVLNVAIWAIIFLTTINRTFTSNTSKDYELNVLMLGIASFLEAISVFFTGLLTAVRIQRHIEKLLQQRAVHLEAQEVNMERNSFASDAYDFLSRKKKLRHLDVIWQMVIFTLVVTAILLARCIVILYVEFFKGSPSFHAADQIFYPFFYYEIPEFSITFLIAYGISPPQGLLRRVVQRVHASLTHPAEDKSSLSSSRDIFAMSSSNPMHSVDSSRSSIGRRSSRSSSLRQSSMNSPTDRTRSESFRTKTSIGEHSVDSSGGAGGGESFNGDGSLSSTGSRIMPSINVTLSSIDECEAMAEDPEEESKEDPQGESKEDAVDITAASVSASPSIGNRSKKALPVTSPSVITSPSSAAQASRRPSFGLGPQSHFDDNGLQIAISGF